MVYSTSNRINVKALGGEMRHTILRVQDNYNVQSLVYPLRGVKP
jgi:hypothetical protein